MLFLDNFDAPPAAASPPPVAPVLEPAPLTSADVEEARAHGYQRGRADAAAEEAVLTRVALTAIAASLHDATERAGTIAEASAAALARLLLDVAIAACLSLRERLGEAEVRRFVQAVLPGLSREPLVTIHVHPSLVSSTAGALAEFPGRHEIVAADGLLAGDVAIHWTDGSARLCGKTICGDIRDLFDSLGLTTPEIAASTTTTGA